METAAPDVRPTLAMIEQQPHLGSGELQEGTLYQVVRASFGQSEDYIGGKNLAHVVLKCPTTSRYFVLVPTLEPRPGPDGKIYPERGLTCMQIARQ